ncbi:ABC transporter substrate-binding protein [Zhihengliuella sp.]|uniref:ABC transporter substrate-binding protein n=1 Tax=Zhihengliuella sp. TaxID=1954483 RepID=UPI0028109EA4|nr:ABC transporter substrate-binding protein [Zhihengliuella sp.]
MSFRTRTLRVAAAVAASAAVVGLSACGGSTEASGGGADGEVRDVTLMLNWYPYGEHAPFYYGVDEGIFEEHGINLTIKAGQGSTKTVQAVGQGQVDFGWADTPPVLANVDKGVKVKSIGVFLQTTPSAVQVFADSGIESPADLEGKTIAVSSGDAPTTTFPVFLEAAGVEADAVNQQNLDAAGKMAAMMSGQVDGLIGFAHDQGPTIAAKSGKDVEYLRYSDAGLNFFSNGLVANAADIESDPELMEDMLAAVSESFEAAIEDPEAAAASMEGKDPQLPAQDVVLEQWKQTMELLHTDATEGMAPGLNDPADWENTIKILSDAGIIEEAKPAETYFDGSFAPEGK